MNPEYNILVFPGGSEVGLEIHRALAPCENIHLFSASSEVPNHAPYVFKNHFVVPDIRTTHWMDKLNTVIESNQIDYIYPAYDDVLLALSDNQKKIKCRILIPSQEACTITRSKSLTYRRFESLLPTPKQYPGPEEVNRWPVFLKPERGQGSQRTLIADNSEDLKYHLKKNKDFLILEYLPGKEYTVDCFSNRSGRLLFSRGRERIRIKNGISMNSRTVEREEFESYAQVISKNLNLLGAWFYQVKERANGELVLMEIAPRIGGTMATHRVLGINFPLLTIYVHSGIEVELLLNQYSVEIDRALINRYKHNLIYDIIYVDFNNTLILKGKVNVPVLSFLYQARNAGKKIVLLTKVQKNVVEQLQSYTIDSHLFDKIVCMDNFHPDQRSILIDNRFSERKEVAEKDHIPTFDGSMVEMLVQHQV